MESNMSESCWNDFGPYLSSDVDPSYIWSDDEEKEQVLLLGRTNTHLPAKKPRLADRSIYAYRKLKSTDFLHTMTCGRSRVKRLLSKGTGFNDKLKALEAWFNDLLQSAERNKNSLAERRRLVVLTKNILRHWKFIENQIGRSVQLGISPHDMAPSDYPHAVPSAWLFEDDWHDMAYEEVVSLRNKHSYLLDEAFIESYKPYFQRNKNSGSQLHLFKKHLNLLGSSREDICFLSKKKCYKHVMGIKKYLVEREREWVSDPQSLRVLSLDETQKPNWRDEIYDEIRSSRNLYSRKLDKVFKEIHLHQYITYVDYTLYNFLCEAMQFLANCRGGVVLLTEDSCREKLNDIKNFIENAEDSVPAKLYAKHLESVGPSACPTELANDTANWRDVAYEEVQLKAQRFIYRVYNKYHVYRLTWFKIPELYACVKRIDEHINSALFFYLMPRVSMSLLESEDDYFKWVDTLTIDIYNLMVLINWIRKSLGKEDDEEWSHYHDLIPKRNWLARLQFLKQGEKNVDAISLGNIPLLDEWVCEESVFSAPEVLEDTPEVLEEDNEWEVIDNANEI